MERLVVIPEYPVRALHESSNKHTFHVTFFRERRDNKAYCSIPALMPAKYDSFYTET